MLLTWSWRWRGLVSGIVVSMLLIVGSQLWPLLAWIGESRQAIEDVIGIVFVNTLASIVAGWIVVQWVRADTALYEAKHAGRSRYMIFDNVNAAVTA